VDLSGLTHYNVSTSNHHEARDEPLSRFTDPDIRGGEGRGLWGDPEVFKYYPKILAGMYTLFARWTKPINCSASSPRDSFPSQP